MSSDTLTVIYKLLFLLKLNGKIVKSLKKALTRMYWEVNGRLPTDLELKEGLKTAKKMYKNKIIRLQK